VATQPELLDPLALFLSAQVSRGHRPATANASLPPGAAQRSFPLRRNDTNRRLLFANPTFAAWWGAEAVIATASLADYFVRGPTRPAPRLRFSARRSRGRMPGPLSAIPWNGAEAGGTPPRRCSSRARLPATALGRSVRFLGPGARYLAAVALTNVGLGLAATPHALESP